jgi:Flp pilus assembly protein TadD
VFIFTAFYRGWGLAAYRPETYGVHAYIEKPFDLRDVVRAVDDALAGRVFAARPPAEEFSAEAKRLYADASEAYRKGDLDLAISGMASAVALDPLSASLRHQLGLLYAQRGHDFAAIQELEMAIDLDPARFQSLRNLAILFQRRGMRRKACEMWERALSNAPDDATRHEIRDILLQLF